MTTHIPIEIRIVSPCHFGCGESYDLLSAVIDEKTKQLRTVRLEEAFSEASESELASFNELFRSLDARDVRNDSCAKIIESFHKLVPRSAYAHTTNLSGGVFDMIMKALGKKTQSGAITLQAEMIARLKAQMTGAAPSPHRRGNSSPSRTVPSRDKRDSSSLSRGHDEKAISLKDFWIPRTIHSAGRLYIPGSALKGAFVTGAQSKGLERTKNGIHQQNLIPSFSFSDFHPVGACIPEVIFAHRTSRSLHDGPQSIPIETVPQATIFRGTLSVSSTTNHVDAGNDESSIMSLLNDASVFFKNLLSQEKDFRLISLPAGGAFIRMGRFSGYRSRIPRPHSSSSGDCLYKASPHPERKGEEVPFGWMYVLPILSLNQALV
jgi:hypothetical protein